MNEEAGFLRAIQDNPDDRSLHLVYADWLEDHGDLRAEYLRLEDQLSQNLARLEQLSHLIDSAWLAAIRRRGVRGRLRVQHGLEPNREYPIYEGPNFLGRADEQPVDIDLGPQEPPESVWSSRQHALITWENGELTIEDLNSSNGTYVNRLRVYPGQRHTLQANDVIQIGTIQMRVIQENPPTTEVPG